MGRKLAMQALYQSSIRSENVENFLDEFIHHSKVNAAVSSWCKELVEGAWAQLNKSDELIEQYSIGWSLDRISAVDLSILRLAFYELEHTDTPYTIVVDEAIELSKEFSSKESSGFINGILGNYVKEHVYRNNKENSKS